MSRTKLAPKTQLEIWLRAGGRCEYPGCNAPLWQDTLTLARMNRAYLAHIVADRPDGPRGHPVISEQLKDDPENIMLLCDMDHRRIDVADVAGHPVELLQRYKREHEERIERQTGLQPNLRTHVVRLGTRIADRHGRVSYDQACQAVLPSRYPADEVGLRLDLAENQISEEDEGFWALSMQYIDRRLAGYLDDNTGPGGRPLNHLSIFALAPIPVLIFFGRRLGDIVSADVYQRHRDTGDWRWQPLGDEAFDYAISRPGDTAGTTSRVAVNLSLSGTVLEAEIARVMGEDVPTYTMTIARPGRDFLRAKEQLELFSNEWSRLLTEIRANHGEECAIHLFPAVPCAIAVEIGRALLPKSDPRLLVYHHDARRGGFSYALTV